MCVCGGGGCEWRVYVGGVGGVCEECVGSVCAVHLLCDSIRRSKMWSSLIPSTLLGVWE